MSGVGLHDDPETGLYVAPPDPTTRWDHYNYDRSDFTDAFGVGYSIGQRRGFISHESCSKLLEKAFERTLVPCVRLYDICQPLAQPLGEDFLSWGHGYGGLVAVDAARFLP